jgi:4-hydroxy-tetrahydrodipicolinate synthase
VIAGAGSNSTSQAIDFTKDAEAAGADATLSVVPYYNKPTQAGMEAHFRAIASASRLPMVLYDVPSRTAVGLDDETVARLAEHPRIIGLKDATGDVTRLPRLRALVGEDFRLLSGDDRTAFNFIAQGGHGCISVTSNVAPGLCRAMYLALRRDQAGLAARIATVVTILTDVLFRESNPGPVKSALALLNVMPEPVRLPLVEPSQETKAELAAVLADVYARYPDWIAGRPTQVSTSSPDGPCRLIGLEARFGSEAGIARAEFYVRFASESGPPICTFISTRPDDEHDYRQKNSAITSPKKISIITNSQARAAAANLRMIFQRNLLPMIEINIGRLSLLGHVPGQPELGLCAL